MPLPPALRVAHSWGQRDPSRAPVPHPRAEGFSCPLLLFVCFPDWWSQAINASYNVVHAPLSATAAAQFNATAALQWFTTVQGFDYGYYNMLWFVQCMRRGLFCCGVEVLCTHSCSASQSVPVSLALVLCAPGCVTLCMAAV